MCECEHESEHEQANGNRRAAAAEELSIEPRIVRINGVTINKAREHDICSLFQEPVLRRCQKIDLKLSRSIDTDIGKLLSKYWK